MRRTKIGEVTQVAIGVLVARQQVRVARRPRLGACPTTTMTLVGDDDHGATTAPAVAAVTAAVSAPITRASHPLGKVAGRLVAQVVVAG
jgi:hypothetical protein